MEMRLVFILLIVTICYNLSAKIEVRNSIIDTTSNSDAYFNTKRNSYDTLCLDNDKKFVNQVNKSRTIYVIESSFDLNGKKILLPEHSFLLFRGEGRICNGVLVGKNTGIFSLPIKIFDNVKLEGLYACSLNVRWFGVSPHNSDNSACLETALSSSSNNVLEIPGGIYLFKKKVSSYVRNAYIKGETYRSTTTTMFKYVPETTEGSSRSNSFLNLKAFDVTIENIAIVSSKGGKNLVAIEICDSVLPGQIDSNIRNCYISNFGRCIVAHGRGIKVENNLFSNTNCCLHYVSAAIQATKDVAQNPPYDGRGVIFVRNKCHGIDKINEVFNGSALVLEENDSHRRVNNYKSSVLAMFICENELDNTGSLLNCFLPIGDSIISGNVLVKSVSSAITCSSDVNGLVITNNIFGKYISTTSETATTIISLGTNAGVMKNININNNILKDCTEEAISLKDKESEKDGGIVVSNNIFSNIRYVLHSEGANYENIVTNNNIYNLRGDGSFSKGE